MRTIADDVTVHLNDVLQPHTKRGALPCSGWSCYVSFEVKKAIGALHTSVKTRILF